MCIRDRYSTPITRAKGQVIRLLPFAAVWLILTGGVVWLLVVGEQARPVAARASAARLENFSMGTTIPECEPAGAIQGGPGGSIIQTWAREKAGQRGLWGAQACRSISRRNRVGWRP